MKCFFTGVFYLEMIAPFKAAEPELDTVAAAFLDSIRIQLNSTPDVDNIGMQLAASSLNDLYLAKHEAGSLQDQYTSMSTKFSGKLLRLLQFQFLKKHLFDHNPSVGSLIRQYAGQANDDYSTYLQTEALASGTSAVSDVIIGIPGDTIAWERYFETLKGHVVYVDFWASWCIPCRREMPFSRKLQSSFAGDPVRFVFVSLDHSMNQWLSATHQEKLPLQHSFLLRDEASSLIKKRFHLNTIPRYFIMNKDGVIVDSDAPRPSDKRTESMIKKLLLEERHQ